MNLNNKTKIARVLAIVQDGNITPYVEDTLEHLSSIYDVVLEVENINNLNLSNRVLPLVIFDNIDSKLIDKELLSANTSTIPCFIYANDKYQDGMIEELYSKKIDFIIDKKTIKANEFALALSNSFERFFQIEGKSRILCIDEFKIDTFERRVWKADEEIRLTDIEFRMLVLFIKNCDEVLPIKKIFKEIWKVDDKDTSRIVTQYVHRLKSKIGKDYISNISNIGYVWNKKK